MNFKDACIEPAFQPWALWDSHSLILRVSRIFSSLAHQAQHFISTCSCLVSSRVTSFTNSSCAEVLAMTYQLFLCNWSLCTQQLLGLWKGSGERINLLLSNKLQSLPIPTHYEDPCQNLPLAIFSAVQHGIHHPSSKPGGWILGPEDASVSTRLVFLSTILVHAAGDIYVPCKIVLKHIIQSKSIEVTYRTTHFVLVDGCW